MLESILRKYGREAMGLEDGDYFDSMVFDAQAKAVVGFVQSMADEGHVDIDYVLHMLRK